MTWEVTAEPSRFDEAVEWFAGRFPTTEETAAEIDGYAEQRAFKIAGVAQLEVVQQVHESLTDAIATGIPFEEWQRQIRDDLTKAWGRPDSHRIETIFRNANQQSYNAGRWRQMHHPDVVGLRPYGFFDGVVDSRQTDICRNWDGTILPLEEFAQRGACPQLHHRCRSNIRSITEREAKRRGGVTAEVPTDTADAGFGQAPTEADWQPDPSKYDPGLFATYEAKRQTLQRD